MRGFHFAFLCAPPTGGIKAANRRIALLCLLLFGHWASDDLSGTIPIYSWESVKSVFCIVPGGVRHQPPESPRQSVCL